MVFQANIQAENVLLNRFPVAEQCEEKDAVAGVGRQEEGTSARQCGRSASEDISDSVWRRALAGRNSDRHQRRPSSGPSATRRRPEYNHARCPIAFSGG